MTEILIDTGTNANVLFAPAMTTVRGAFSPAAVAHPEIGELCRTLPAGVPAQTIAFDATTNTGFIRDPLATPEHAKTRAAIEQRAGGTRFEYPPAEQRFPNADAATWLGWMRRLVAAGVARVVRGKLPDSDPEGMKKSFFHQERSDPKDAQINQLLALLAAQLPDGKRKELAALFAPAK